MEEIIQGLEDIKIKVLKELTKYPKNKELKELIVILDECINKAENAK